MVKQSLFESHKIRVKVTESEMKYQSRILNLVSCLLRPAIVVVSLSSILPAQNPVPGGAYEVQADGMAVVPAIGMPSKEKLGGAKQYELLNLYAIEISRIDAAAKLDDAQKSKLSVAAKELAREKAQEFASSPDSMMAGAVMPVGGAPALPVKPKADQPKIKLEEVKSYADLDIETKFMLENTLIPKASQHEDADWIKLVKSVVTPEQYDKYEQAIAAQKKIIEKTMVDAGIATLSVDLVFSQDQENKLRALLMEQLAKPKPAAPNLSDPMMMGVAAYMEALGIFLELAKVDSTKLRNVLDPQQFELLDLKLNSFRQVIAEMETVGAVAP